MTRILCAWCGAIMAEGSEPVSHGICPRCEAGVEAERLGLLSLAAIDARLRWLLAAVEACEGEDAADYLDEIGGLRGELLRRAQTLHNV